MLWKRLRRVLAGRSLAPPPPPVFPTFKEAAARCVTNYELDGLVEVIFQKTRRVSATPAKQLRWDVDANGARMLAGLALAGEGRDALHALDSGGACGAHYFLASAVFDRRIRRWHVVETPAMAARAQAVATDELRFFSSISDAVDALQSVDAVHSSGTLQYLPSPLGTLGEIMALRAPWLLLARLGLADDLPGGAPTATIQESWLRDNGPGPLPEGLEDRRICIPVGFLDRTAVERAVQTDYEIALRCTEGVLYRLGRTPICGYGYVCRRRPTAVTGGPSPA